ncbi:type I restriction endonuclease subunit S [Sphingomonas sp. AP4-R1]|uniref:restriction endonuclease subunit S n=1 Tax=Sphingomonas sp. AP4-R1 TaxID=2735134 RepID=UPI001493D0B3|nr:restriction endonuclease subunit S [Sphingomonas sp. AP4-R1]QJU57113.1 type I restriction endonuclease subunit S [Sphingomonas sp. AP4-R1]
MRERIGWASVPLREVAEINPRKSVDLEMTDAVTFVPMAAVDEVSGTITDRVERPLREVRSGFTQFRENDVIVAKITPSMENGKAAIATDLANGVGFGSTEFHVIRSKGALLPDFIWRFVRQRSFRDEAQKVMSGAVGQQRVPAEFLKSYMVPLPPLAEQRRIVDKSNALIARTSRATAELAQIPMLIARYRSIVLDLAFSGRLTRDLRNQNHPDAGSLPEGWSIRALGEISEIQGGIQVGRRRKADEVLVEVPYLRVANVQRGWLKLDEIKTISVTETERDRLLLREGDVLMNEGGDRDKLGRGWVWEEQIDPCIHQNHVFRIRLKDGTLPPKYLSHFANEKGQSYFFDEGTQTTNLASISKRKVAALPVPVPPWEEAAEISRRIEAAFGWLDRVVADHTTAMEFLPKLEAAIWTKAFSGALVSQDATEEPADALLARQEAGARQSTVSNRRHPKSDPKEIKTMVSRTSLSAVLSSADGWVSGQEAFELCGIGANAATEDIEALYSELRELDINGQIESKPVTDDQGRKLYDRLRWKRS